MLPDNIQKMNKKIFFFLGLLVAVGGLLSYLSVFFPLLFTVIINFFWIMMLISVSVFLILGFLVIIGLKDEVSSFLDVVLEGSLSIIDAIELIKKLYVRFIEVLKEFIYFITPILAVWAALLVYFLIIYLYKSVGKSHDVTILTIGLTMFMVAAVGMMNKPVVGIDLTTWASLVKKRFKDFFADAFELVVFLFFLTMDIPNLFFLPEDLRIQLKAGIGDYDLMLRGVNVSHQLTATIFLITVGISLEILRNIIKIVAVGLDIYRNTPKTESKGSHIKGAIRLSFSSSKDDILKFIAFTTTLILVFLLFPRLKLFAMVIASFMGLIMDFAIPHRLQVREGRDLISRLLSKIFKL